MVTRNEIYTYIHDALVAAEPTVFTTSERIYATSRFPTVCIRQMEYTSQRETITPTGESFRSTWEVEAFSDDANGGADKAMEMIHVAETAFRSIGFRMISNFPTENTKEITIKRHIARFTRILCNDDTIGGN